MNPVMRISRKGKPIHSNRKDLSGYLWPEGCEEQITKDEEESFAEVEMFYI